jgi:hypothetical protein
MLRNAATVERIPGLMRFGLPTDWYDTAKTEWVAV